jgi:hypothetical protein
MLELRSNDPFEIPSLEEIKETERQRLQRIGPLQISEFGDSVKYQRCGMAIPIVGKLSRSQNERITILQKRIRWTENYSKVSNIMIPSNLSQLVEMLNP